MSNRRKFTAEFKAEAIELVIASDRPVAQVAPEIGVNEGTLGNCTRRLSRSCRMKHRPAADDLSRPNATTVSTEKWASG